MSQQNPGFSGPNQQSGQPYPGQPAQPYPGQPGQAYPGQPFAGQQPGQSMPGGPNPPYQGPSSPQQPPRKPRKPIWKRWWMICLYVIVAIILATKIGGGGDDSSSDSASTGSESTQTADAGQNAAKAADKATTQATTTKAEPKKAGIGTAVKSGDLTFTVTAFKCGVAVSDPMDQVKPQGQFCKLSVTIANGGKDQATVDDSQIKVQDAKGNEYSTSGDTWAVDGSIFLKDINPGNKMSGAAYFDVPKGVTPVTATFKGGLLSGTAEVSLS